MARVAVLVLGCLAGCRGDPPAPVPATGPTVELTVDDGPPRTVKLAGTVALSTLVDVPAKAWLEVHGAAVDHRELELGMPATRYPGSEVRLYLDQGKPALGVFPPVSQDMPPEVAALARQPTASLTYLASVHVMTRPVTRPGLLIVVGGRDVAITSEQLRALPTLPRGTSRAEGWPLGDVIDLAAPEGTLRSIRVEGPGAPMSIPGDALRDGKQVIVLKQNQRGEYVVRVWEPDGRSPTRELRAVTRIVVD